mmetsp:Transcript_46533/g.133123  ORF Transcript_46533/g.133123 Transcript_46533/m.133123 type:complete len:174 (+) Transcript_46533:1-522(+)
MWASADDPSKCCSTDSFQFFGSDDCDGSIAKYFDHLEFSPKVRSCAKYRANDSSVTAPPGNAAPPVIKRVNGKTATIAPGSNCCLEKIVLPWSPSRSSKLSLNVACISPPRPASSIPSCNQDSKPWNLADASGSTSFASTDGVAWKEPAENKTLPHLRSIFHDRRKADDVEHC